MKKDELFVEIYRRGGGADFAMAETDKVWQWLTKPEVTPYESWAAGYKRNQEALEKAYRAIADAGLHR